MILTEGAFVRMLGKLATAEELVGEGVLTVRGASAKMIALFGTLDDFDPNFAIVTP